MTANCIRGVNVVALGCTPPPRADLLDNLLRSAHTTCILEMLRASARGSGPGCLPDGRGTGFCALRPKFDDGVEELVDLHPPPVVRADRPR